MNHGSFREEGSSHYPCRWQREIWLFNSQTEVSTVNWSFRTLLDTCTHVHTHMNTCTCATYTHMSTPCETIKSHGKKLSLLLLTSRHNIKYLFLGKDHQVWFRFPEHLPNFCFCNILLCSVDLNLALCDQKVVMVRSTSNDPAQQSPSHVETLKLSILGTGQEGSPNKWETAGSCGLLIKKVQAGFLSPLPSKPSPEEPAPAKLMC